ncbi:MAG: hypothetical protein ACI3XI_02680 [Eubacteriales bacterium]
MNSSSYSYSPPRGDKVSTAITYILICAAVVLLILSEVLADIKPFFQASGFAAILIAVMFCSRYVLSGYTYTVRLSDDGERADLVVVENRGKQNRTVCRISATDSRLFKAKKLAGRVYDYRPTPFIRDSWVFEVPEDDGGGFIRFCPDERMIEILRSLGCEVEK